MIVSSRLLSFGAACLLAASLTACDNNDTAPSANPSPSPAPSPSPGPTPTPTPGPGPSATTFTVTGTVAETSPTTDRFLDGVTLSTGERSAGTDSAGRFSIDGLAAGTYTLRASKGGYSDQTVTVTLPADAGRTIQFNIEPQFDTLNRERSGNISQDNSTCSGSSLPCVRYDFPAHHSQTITATVLWESSDAVMNLEIRCGGELIARQTEKGDGEVGRDGGVYLFMELEAESQKGKICDVRVLHVSGPQQRYVLVVSHPN